MHKEILSKQNDTSVETIPFYFESCPKILTKYLFDKRGWLLIQIHDPHPNTHTLAVGLVLEVLASEMLKAMMSQVSCWPGLG